MKNKPLIEPTLHQDARLRSIIFPNKLSIGA